MVLTVPEGAADTTDSASGDGGESELTSSPAAWEHWEFTLPGWRIAECGNWCSWVAAPSETARQAVAELEQSGVQVVVAQADVASTADVQQVIESIDATMPPLHGVVHAAGVLDDGVLMTHKTGRRFEAVMAPKVAGAWNLHRLTIDRPLQAFVMFSSVAGLLGSPGQSSYAAATRSWIVWRSADDRAVCRRVDRLGPLGRCRHGRTNGGAARRSARPIPDS